MASVVRHIWRHKFIYGGVAVVGGAFYMEYDVICI